jgi:large subunit ribosomal protein L6
MSRIGKLPVAMPAGVQISQANGLITVKGSGAELSISDSPLVTVKIESDSVRFEPADASREANAMSGTLRQLVNNMTKGVSQGFEKKLVLVGVGYKASSSGNKLNLAMGFSHPVDMVMPEGIKVETPTPTEILVKGADKQKVGQIAAEIRSVRPPEPYKGKGIRYADEKVVIKETKKK